MKSTFLISCLLLLNGTISFACTKSTEQAQPKSKELAEQSQDSARPAAQPSLPNVQAASAAAAAAAMAANPPTMPVILEVTAPCWIARECKTPRRFFSVECDDATCSLTSVPHKYLFSNYEELVVIKAKKLMKDNL